MERSPDPILPRLQPLSKEQDAAQKAMLEQLRGAGLPVQTVDRKGRLRHKVLRLDAETSTRIGYQPTAKRGLKRFIQVADLYELSLGPYAGRLKMVPRVNGRSGDGCRV